MRYSTLTIVNLATQTACGFAADAGVFFHLPGHPSSGHVLTVRGDTCLRGQAVCDASCIDAAFTCCHVGQGQACQEGYSCYDQGCCRHGQTCRGPPKGCTDTTKMCDVGCITQDRVCCHLGDGSSCEGGTVCLAAGLCGRKEDGSDSSSSSSSSPSGSSQTASSGTGGGHSATTELRTKSESAIGASVTSSVVEGSSGVYSLSLITTASGTAGDVSPGASSTEKPTPTTNAGSSTPSSDKGGAGVAIKAPAILAGLLAAAAYAI